MCQGFGGIITQDGKLFFMEPDFQGNCSHSDLLARLGMEDNDDRFLRPFVRFEFPDWTEASFRYDEDSSLPGWVTDEMTENAKKVLARITPALAEYEKVRAPALAEYEKVRAPAWAEYEKVRAQALAEYEKVRDQAWAEYQKVRDQALAEYQKACAPARAEFIQRISSITGYVPETK